MDKILKFLLGESHFDGYYFGDKHPPFEGIFWWRKHLRKWLTENPTCSPTERAFLDEIREKCKWFPYSGGMIGMNPNGPTNIFQVNFVTNLKDLVDSKEICSLCGSAYDSETHELTCELIGEEIQ